MSRRAAAEQPARSGAGRRALLLRALLACGLGVAAALLISCGSSGKGLIPSANATPLQSDFEEVSQAAQNGNGSCSATEAALAKTESDFNALPPSIDAGLRTRLREGITNLHTRALKLCTQPLSSGTTSTGTTAKTTTTNTQTTPTVTQTTPTVTQTTPTETTSTPTGTSPSTGPGGGTAAPGEGESSKGNGNGDGGGVGPGGQGSPGQEGAK